MSLRGVAKLLRRLGISALFMLAVPAWSWAQQPGEGCAGGACFGTPSTGNCGNCCQTHHCPPAYQHCLEGPPSIHWKCGCPRPVCNPCDLPHWGYFDKCWTQWPYPPNWTHCPTTPPAALVNLTPNAVSPYIPPPSPPRLPAPAVSPGANPGAPSIDGLPQPQRYNPPRPF
jgi:hypothetical protein